MDNEQTWPTEEEMAGMEGKTIYVISFTSDNNLIYVHISKLT